MPFWLFKKCSVELQVDIVAKLFSISYAAGHVFSNWKSAVVTPVAKVPSPTAASDFGAISVTPNTCTYCRETC